MSARVQVTIDLLAPDGSSPRGVIEYIQKALEVRRVALPSSDPMRNLNTNSIQIRLKRKES